VAFGFRALIFWRCLLPAYRGDEREVTGHCREFARLSRELAQLEIDGTPKDGAPKK
jgi:hypothetical protein